MQRLDPIATTHAIGDAYRRYLRSVMRANDPAINAATAAAWDALPGRTPLVAGPILESSPPFEEGRSIRALVDAGVLSRSWLDVRMGPDLPIDRPLYLHQDEAVTHVTGRQRNLVVATGTGSGKTEAFLIPIFDALLREAEQGHLRPGVRALVLYPMNALANDQLKRLRSLLANCPEITFGRYTGETRRSYESALEARRAQRLPDPGPNELICRDQMQATPPHILLTNYAMLEYLLMRPDDSPLFEHDGQGWRFLVLDEVHSYDGALALEIGMLLRRLLDRTGRNPGDVRCVGTSATIGSGEQSFPAVAAFARHLFGAPFEYESRDPARQDVITGTRKPLTFPAPDATMTLERALEMADAGARARALLTIPAAQDILAAIRERPRRAEALANELFPNAGQPAERLTALVDALARHRLPGEGHPLLSARYHTFVRAIEGPSICLRPHGPGGEPFVSLHTDRTCPRCADPAALMAELATCRRCNQWYLRGTFESPRDGSRFVRCDGFADDISTAVKYIAPVSEGADVDDDEAIEEDGSAFSVLNDSEAVNAPMDLVLCIACWKAGDGNPGCGCPPGMHRRFRVAARSPGGSIRCLNCAAPSSASGPRRLRLGSDAPPAVLASTLYDQLPRGDAGETGKFISFADSRQDAAFFALYLERTYGSISRRRLILRALRRTWQQAGGPAGIEDVQQELRKLAEAEGFFDDRESNLARKRTTMGWLIAELTAMDRRQSLEGAGLAVRGLRRPRNWQAPQPLLAPPWNLTPDEAWALIETLLSTLLDSQVVTFPEGVDVTEPLFAPRNRQFHVSRGNPNPKAGLFSWMPPNASTENRRSNYLARVLRAVTGGTAAMEAGHVRAVLDGLWDLMTRAGAPLAQYLVNAGAGTNGETRYQPEYRYWEWEEPEQSLRCSHCGLRAGRAVRGVCPSMRCQGTMIPHEPDDEDHVRVLYQQEGAGAMRVEEHTAQWNPEHAAEIQEQFLQGNVDVLSCSTTFELGVDVGDLQTVFLRNIPPAAANYVQRAGRAGRRRDSVAFVLSFAQLRPHDQHIFTAAEELVAGRVPVPRVPDANARIVRRHMHSVAYSRYFRTQLEPGSDAWATAGTYFIEDGGAAHRGFRAWLPRHPDELQAELRRIVPAEVRGELGVETWGWADELLADDSPLGRAAADVEADETTFQELIDDAVAAKQYKKAAYYEGVLRTVRGRYLLGYLAAKNVLPKYGFPVDVVALKTTHLDANEAKFLDLDRDLRVALAEFAPDSGVVAAKKLWRSAGLRLLPNHNLPIREYARCDECRRFYIDAREEKCPNCQNPIRQRAEFVEPVYGFVAAEPNRSLGDERPQRLFASEVLFAGLGSDTVTPRQPLVVTGGETALEGRFARGGWLAVVNNGRRRGFQFCTKCGFARLGPPAGRRVRTEYRHNNPERKVACSGSFARVHLGHQFATDIVEFTLPRFWPQGATPEQRAGERVGILSALAEGAARALDLRRDDIESTFYIENGVTVFVLYDAVPGGAGIAREIFAHALDVVRAAHQLCERCTGCGPDSSCYACIRSYRNQDNHDHLNRSLAAAALLPAVV